MEGTGSIRSLLRYFSILGMVAFSIFLPANLDRTAEGTVPVVQSAIKPETQVNIPSDLKTALAAAFGDYERVVDQADMMEDLQTADVLLIGEAHYDRRDMQTAFEIIQRLSHRRKIALAVERFSIALQPRLEALNRIGSQDTREEEMRRILQSDEYQTIWGIAGMDQAKFPNPFDASYPRNFPSTEVFEEIMIWAAHAGIPLIGLDLPLSGRATGLGEDIPYRNELWKNQVINYLEKNTSENYLVIAIGGIDHFSNATDSVQAKLGVNPSRIHLRSIGQRNAEYPSLISEQVDGLAKSYRLNDVIIKNPQYAVVLDNGSTLYPTPPDYWIAVHTSDSREN